MSKNSTSLAERRRHLVARAAAQRTALAQDLAPWRAPLALADQGIAALRYIKRHPLLSVGTTMAFAALRPQHTGKRLMQAWVLWKLARTLLKSKPTRLKDH